MKNVKELGWNYKNRKYRALISNAKKKNIYPTDMIKRNKDVDLVKNFKILSSIE